MEMDNYFPLKPDLTVPPNIYLGGKVSKVVFPTKSKLVHSVLVNMYIKL